MPVPVILFLTFAAVFMLVGAAMAVLRPRQFSDVERINNLYYGAVSMTAAAGKPASARLPLKAYLEKLSLKIGQFYERDQKRLAKIRQSFIQAGYYSDESLRRFLTIRLVGTVLFFIVFFYAGLAAGKPLNQAFFIGLLMSLVGYLLPSKRLSSKVRQRQDMIGNALPDALDLLVISVEAGMGLNAAILKVGQEMQLRSPALSEEFLLVNQEIRAGLSREEALRNLGNRNRNENLRILVSAIIMADKLGSSVADTLRSQSDSLRARVRQKVEEQAAKAGVKLLFPLVFFILPALFLVILGPGFLMILKAFSEMR